MAIQPQPAAIGKAPSAAFHPAGKETAIHRQDMPGDIGRIRPA